MYKILANKLYVATQKGRAEQHIAQIRTTLIIMILLKLKNY
jgi:hypothetical protein